MAQRYRGDSLVIHSSVASTKVCCGPVPRPHARALVMTPPATPLPQHSRVVDAARWWPLTLCAAPQPGHDSGCDEEDRADDEQPEQALDHNAQNGQDQPDDQQRDDQSHTTT